jgi:phosphatidylinositol 4-kinase
VADAGTGGVVVGSGGDALPLPDTTLVHGSAVVVVTASAGAGGGASPAAKPVSVVFAERWREKEARLAAGSPFAHLPGWRLMPVIVKANDDLRQEQFVSQLVHQFAAIFRRTRVPVWLRPYDILATAPRGGLIQAIQDTVSIDALKRGDPAFTTLDDWFERHFNYGARGGERVKAARLNFVRSMAAYSVVCYLLNIKDRHNGNILIDRKGHIIHIDFGFLLTSSPGGNINFEGAPFKLTQEMLQVMGGPRSTLFGTFRKLCIRGFLAARKYRERIILLVEMMLSGNSDLSCFRGGPAAVVGGVRGRFREGLNDRACALYFHSLIDQSIDNWRTRWYDHYQRWAQGVL